MNDDPNADRPAPTGDTGGFDGAPKGRGAPDRRRAGACDYDAELRLHAEALRRAWRIRPDDHVLDVGCGTGQMTREAARGAVAGSALGVDISAPAIERARARARAEGLRNVTFECADVQSHDFPQEHFDRAVSRFGTMFFDEPVTAFTTIGRALRPAGSLVMMVWQAPERNAWDVAIRRSLGAGEGPAPVAAGWPDPFSLADPATVTGILTAAGFAEAAFADVREPVFYGPDVDSALAWIRGFVFVRELVARLDRAAAARALERLRTMLAAHLRDDGVWFDSRSWIVTARRR